MKSNKAIKPIDEVIDDLPMHKMTGEEAIKKVNPNSLSARLERRQVRYALYCMRSKQEGKILPEDFDSTLPSKFEEQEGFDGWSNFAITWDVTLHNPYKITSRHFSEAEEWERVVQAKFPQIQPDGTVRYPDLSVKIAVDKESKNQAKLKKRKKK